MAFNRDAIKTPTIHSMPPHKNYQPQTSVVQGLRNPGMFILHHLMHVDYCIFTLSQTSFQRHKTTGMKEGEVSHYLWGFISDEKVSDKEVKHIYR